MANKYSRGYIARSEEDIRIDKVAQEVFAATGDKHAAMTHSKLARSLNSEAFRNFLGSNQPSMAIFKLNASR